MIDDEYNAVVEIRGGDGSWHSMPGSMRIEPARVIGVDLAAGPDESFGGTLHHRLGSWHGAARALPPLSIAEFRQNLERLFGLFAPAAPLPEAEPHPDPIVYAARCKRIRRQLRNLLAVADGGMIGVD